MDMDKDIVYIYIPKYNFAKFHKNKMLVFSTLWGSCGYTNKQKKKKWKQIIIF